MDPTEILQKAVSLLATLSQDGSLNVTASTNSTTSADTTTGATAATAAMGISSLITMLLSFSALRDWLKLFVIGGMIESCRRILLLGWKTVLESLWISATFDCDDDSYSKLCATSDI